MEKVVFRLYDVTSAVANRGFTTITVELPHTKYGGHNENYAVCRNGCPQGAN